MRQLQKIKRKKRQEMNKENTGKNSRQKYNLKRKEKKTHIGDL